MPETTPAPAAPAPIPRDALRVVLFGMPGAGKSSLLGALDQAARTQQAVLGGRLTDPSHGLDALRHHLYEDRPPETRSEVVPYPVTVEPIAPEGDGAPAVPLALVDCDGRAADELLARSEALRPDRPLAREVLDADTLILVVDASANAARLDRDFGQFRRFLGLLEQGRARRSAVGGLPVYLVLTKCDLLAQPGDTAVAWMDRIEERKRQVGRRFQEFLGRGTGTEPLPFGSIDLNLWATAVKRPALGDTPARPQEPYGVAELFRQCVESAQTFHHREARAGWRLGVTVLASLGVLAGLGALAAYLFATQPARKLNEFQVVVEGYRALDRRETPAQRYRNPKAKVAQLETFLHDRSFATLPRELQEYVRGQHRKLAAYQTLYSSALWELQRTLVPRDATSEEQLKEIEAALNRLRGKLQAVRESQEYLEEWAQSPVGRLPDQWQREIDLLRQAVDRAVRWYHRLYQDGKKVLGSLNEGNLLARAQQVLDEAKNPPLPLNDPDKPIPGAAPVTYGTVYHFSSVVEARERWEEVRRKLRELLKLGKP